MDERRRFVARRASAPPRATDSRAQKPSRHARLGRRL